MTASAGGVRAGKAFVEFFADSSPFVRGLKQMDKQLQVWGSRISSVGKTLTGIGAAAAAAFAPAALSFAATGDALSKMSQRTGASAESLSILKYAAESAGATLDDVKSVFDKVRSDAGSVAQGNIELARSYAKIGLNLGQLASLKPEDQFAVLLDRISRIRNPTMQAAAAYEVLGGAAEALLPLIRQGSSGLADAAKRARELGITNGDAAKAGEAMTQAFYDIKTATLSLVNAVGGSLTPEITSISKVVADYIATAGEWVRNNRQVIVTVAKVVAVVAAVGAGLVAAGAIISTIGTAIGLIATAFTGIGAILGALLSPIGLVVAGIAAGTAAFLTLTETGQGVLSTLMTKFGELGSFMGETWSGITSLIAAGDFGKAAELAFAALNVAWTSTIASVRGVWDSWVNYFRNTWDTAVTVMSKLMINVWSGIQYAGVQAWDFILDAFDGFRSAILRIGAIILEQLAKPLSAVAGLIDQIAGTDFKSAIDSMSKSAAGAVSGAADLVDSQIYDREQRRKQTLSGIESTRQGANQLLDQQLAYKIASRSGGQDKAVTEASEAYQKALGEYQSAVNEAKQVKADMVAGKTTSASGGGPKNEPAQNFMGAVKASTQGSFSAAAAARFSSTGKDPQLTQLQEINRGIRTLVSNKAAFEN